MGWSVTSIITAISARSGRSPPDRACVVKRQWSWSRNRSNQRSDNRLFVPFPFVNDLERNADLFVACLRRDLDANALVFRRRGVDVGKVAVVRCRRSQAQDGRMVG